MRHLILGILCATVLVSVAGVTRANDEIGRIHKWDPKTVDMAGRLPVQEGGRVKPLLTYARFTLLAVSGRTTAKSDTGEDLDSVEWLLDCLFFPEVAQDYPVFLVQDSDVLQALSLSDLAKKKRDRYSFAQLAPARAELVRKLNRYGPIDAKDRTRLQGQIVDLASNYLTVERILHFLDFTGNETAIDYADALALIPPPGSAADAPEWLTPKSLAEAAVRNPERYAPQTALLGMLPKLVGARNQPKIFSQQLSAFFQGVTDLARDRGEYSKVPLEVAYYHLSPLMKSLILFILGFVLLSATWLLPRQRWLYWSSNGVLVAGTAFLVAAIVMRCIIRSRPPVSTLYETILFITATAVITALAVEWINRRRIAIVFAAALGMAGMFLAYTYEMKDASDTMHPLMAVLRTNFWLSTHVTTVTLGYSAGLLACAIGHLYVLGRVFGLKRGDAGWYRGISRMIYGVLCFGLVFSVLGTILGGVWANDSWGRFWGWDPKENGALMIVLWELAVLHGRLAGYLKDFGLALACVFGGAVVAFSWWGVNLLGVGLHSYGFTSGALKGLLSYYALESLVVAGGIGWWLWARAHGALTTADSRTDLPTDRTELDLGGDPPPLPQS